MATSIVALWLLFISHSSVLNWVKATVEVKRQEKEMARLNAEMDQMDREIENLSQNRDSIEAYAREHYRFAAPGDDVYIIE
ncbi:MAG: septum formation initiator family protein [Bacteroidales bacterium]|nr:septum formation initiator family protein [Bacteroidales bacterium]